MFTKTPARFPLSARSAFLTVASTRLVRFLP